MELSLALKKREFRNEILEKVEQQLWIGKIDSAIKILENIDKDNIKCESNIQRLIGQGLPPTHVAVYFCFFIYRGNPIRIYSY
jgi:hypothetical protein